MRENGRREGEKEKNEIRQNVMMNSREWKSVERESEVKESQLLMNYNN